MEFAKEKPIATWIPSVTVITSFLNSSLCFFKSSGTKEGVSLISFAGSQPKKRKDNKMIYLIVNEG